MRLAISAFLLLFGLSAAHSQLMTLARCIDVVDQNPRPGQKAHFQLGTPLPLLLGLDPNAKLSVVTVVIEHDFHVRRFLNDLISVDRGDGEADTCAYERFPVPEQWTLHST